MNIGMEAWYRKMEGIGAGVGVTVGKQIKDAELCLPCISAGLLQASFRTRCKTRSKAELLWGCNRLHEDSSSLK